MNDRTKSVKAMLEMARATFSYCLSLEKSILLSEWEMVEARKQTLQRIRADKKMAINIINKQS